jgi:hypothetical protein
VSEPSITQTVEQALVSTGLSSYRNAAQPIITRLEERERRLSQEIITFATGEGMSLDTARQQLTALGMAVPMLQPVSTMTGTAPEAPPPVGSVASADAQNNPPSTEDLLARIAQQLDGLTQFARDNGYQG